MLYEVITTRIHKRDLPILNIMIVEVDILPAPFEHEVPPMSLTPEQIALVQSSFTQVALASDQTARQFYERLFELDRITSYNVCYTKLLRTT